MSSTPSTKIMTSEPSEVADEFVPPPAGAEHIGQGVGVGSAPPVSCVPPPDCADAAKASANTNSKVPTNLFINESPLVVDRSGLTPASITHLTTPVDPYTALLDSLIDRKDFNRAADLCREKQMRARDAESCVRWAKDGAIVDALQGNYTAAYNQLAAVHYVAESLTGRTRAKYEDELGLVLIEFGRTSTALSHFRLAIDHHHSVGYLRGCAAVRHNAGRAYAVRGELVKAMRCFHRALTYARSVNDYRLEGEVCASLVEFGGGE